VSKFIIKFNTGSLPLRGILPVKKKHHIFAPTAYTQHCVIFLKVCLVIELVLTIKKGAFFF